MGLIGGLITVYPPEGRGYNLPEYEPLWAAAEALEIPLGWGYEKESHTATWN